MRLCKDCGKEFEPDKKHKRHCCLYCHNIRSKKSKYGLNRDEVLELWSKENCDICERPLNKKNIDHCHKTGKVRGVLCTQCNTGLGKFQDDIDVMHKAIEYLKSK